jgi:hypothetical protein
MPTKPAAARTGASRWRRCRAQAEVAEALPPADAERTFSGAAQTLQALRARGAARLDPVGLALAEALLRRGARQDDAVRRWLAPRLDRAIADVAARVDAAGQEAAAPAPAPALLVLRQALGADAADELKSVRRFRPALARWRVERQIARAQARGPDNPGPLNSEHLLLRALQQMQAAAPDYLGAFVTQVETLLWLDEARGGVATDEPLNRAGRRLASR